VEADRIEYWGAGLQQQVTLHAVKVPVGWRFYFDVELTCRVACRQECVRRPETLPRSENLDKGDRDE
jgi:hypothetical protein